MNYSDRETDARNRERSKKRIMARREEIVRKRRILITAMAMGLVLIVILCAFVGKAWFGNNDEIADALEDAVLVIEEIIGDVDIVSMPEIDEQLISINEYSRPGTAITEVQNIVIHYTGNPGTTAQQNRDYYESLSLTHQTSVSSNFVVGMEGEIILCVPTDEVAYASNEANSTSISIEVCHWDDTGEFTEEAYQSVVHLTAWLCEQFDLDSEAVIRHYDVTGKECPLYYVVNEDEWITLKEDVQAMLDGTLVYE